jgi:hypothetical protein
MVYHQFLVCYRAYLSVIVTEFINIPVVIYIVSRWESFYYTKHENLDYWYSHVNCFLSSQFCPKSTVILFTEYSLVLDAVLSDVDISFQLILMSLKSEYCFSSFTDKKSDTQKDLLTCSGKHN